MRFGGPLARLSAGETAGPGGLNPRISNLLIYPRLLDGTPNFCCTGGTPPDAGPVPLVLTGWLVAFLLTASLGVVCAARQGRLLKSCWSVYRHYCWRASICYCRVSRPSASFCQCSLCFRCRLPWRSSTWF